MFVDRTYIFSKKCLFIYFDIFSWFACDFVELDGFFIVWTVNSTGSVVLKNSPIVKSQSCFSTSLFHSKGNLMYIF